MSLCSWSELQTDKQLVQLPVPPSAGEHEVSPEVTHTPPGPEETVRFPKRSCVLSASRLQCEECSDVIQIRRNFNIKQWLLFTIKTPWKSFFRNKTIS